MRIAVLLTTILVISGCVGVSYTDTTTRTQEITDSNRRLFFNLPSSREDGIYKSEYSERHWCGTTIFIGIPIPLMLPVCEYGDEYIYKDKKLVQVNHNKINSKTFVCGPFVWVFNIAHDYKDFYVICGGKW